MALTRAVVILLGFFKKIRYWAENCFWFVLCNFSFYEHSLKEPTCTGGFTTPAFLLNCSQIFQPKLENTLLYLLLQLFPLNNHWRLKVQGHVVRRGTSLQDQHLKPAASGSFLQYLVAVCLRAGCPTCSTQNQDIIVLPHNTETSFIAKSSELLGRFWLEIQILQWSNW